MTKKTSASTETPTPDDPGVSPKRDKKDGLRAEIDHLKTTVRQAVIVASIAVVAVVSTPIWVPYASRMFDDSDPASARVLVLAVEHLRPALSSSAPFDHQMVLVRRMMAGDREVSQILDRIEAVAPHGVASLQEIRSDFMAVANRIFVAELFRIHPDERWINRALVRMASAIRPHDLARTLELNSVGPASALLAEAAHRLSQDDLANAVRAMERLQGGYGTLAEPWLAKVRARQEAGRAFEMLETLAEARLPVSFKRPAGGTSDTSAKMLNNHRHN